MGIGLDVFVKEVLGSVEVNRAVSSIWMLQNLES